MNGLARDTLFVPRLYDEQLVPLIFAAYAADLAQRVAARPATSVLEIAAGTGAVTRELAARLPTGTTIVATDLQQPMLDFAMRVGTGRPIEWRQADALQLPFASRTFDVVACQFGVMFFPDKARAFAEARRVLRPGGALIFNVWDRIEENDFADAVTAALAAMFPADPPRFLPRVPHGYSDIAAIRRDLAAGGFNARPQFETVTARSAAASPRIPALAYCLGTPLRAEIEMRKPSGLEAAVDAVEALIAERLGDGPVEGRLKAHVVVAET
ncbi:methyltransferase type 11 [Mizugakiibacter sediminis]|uniref:Methyltransferase type 11 n=1 Tax=Mizugakiibacter sediminis TaxID=1475481 RepID=A0A0K8QSB5_9GAMM|nr:class I SAM-dependent methyltransferase [Mizugakiibacter sediminis]GAP67536.1 methyltransferase type 11 [Mizugakiibacter sediminis]